MLPFAEDVLLTEPFRRLAGAFQGEPIVTSIVANLKEYAGPK